VDQVLYDAGQTRNAVKSADLSRQMTGEEHRRTQMQVIAGVVRAYYGAVLRLKASDAEQALKSAQADLTTGRIGPHGRHVDRCRCALHPRTSCAVTEQRIQRAADLDVAKSALNDALGLPLDTGHVLSTVLSPLDLPNLTLASLEKGCLLPTRPEAHQIHLAADLAKTQVDSARSAAASAGHFPRSL